MIVVYDADCGVCQASVAWVKERDRHGVFEFVGNESAQLPPGVSHEETEHTMIVLDCGRRFVRAEGVARILSELRGWSAIGALLRAPGVKHFARWGYDKFAQNRHRVSAALGVRACAMPPRKRPKQLSK